MIDQHKPDILSCIANLSSDEVFTPPKVVNEILDLLPRELFENPRTTFLDPCCKSGVFLREIAKRLLVGLESAIPDLQKRIDHIFHNQLFGLALTELTGLMSRRSVYCSKDASGQYSVSPFRSGQGHIRFKRCEHDFTTASAFNAARRKANTTAAKRWKRTPIPSFTQTGFLTICSLMSLSATRRII